MPDPRDVFAQRQRYLQSRQGGLRRYQRSGRGRNPTVRRGSSGSGSIEQIVADAIKKTSGNSNRIPLEGLGKVLEALDYGRSAVTSGVAGSVRDIANRNPRALLNLLPGVGSVMAAAASYADPQTRKDFTERVGSGTQYERALNNASWLKNIPGAENKFTKIGVGITGDVVTDPLTYLGGAGILRKPADITARKLATEGAKNAAAKAARKAGKEAAQEGLDKAARKAASRAAAKQAAREAEKAAAVVARDKSAAFVPEEMLENIGTKGGLYFKLPFARGPQAEMRVLPKSITDKITQPLVKARSAVARSEGGQRFGRLFGKNAALRQATRKGPEHVDEVLASLAARAASKRMPIVTSNAANQFRRAFDEQLKKFEKAGLDEDLAKAIEGDTTAAKRLAGSNLDPTETANTLKEVRAWAKSYGVEIGDIKGYFPNASSEEAKLWRKAAKGGYRQKDVDAWATKSRIKEGDEFAGKTVPKFANNAERREWFQQVANDKYGDAAIDLFESNPRKRLMAYVSSMEHQASRSGLIKELKQKGAILTAPDAKAAKAAKQAKLDEALARVAALSDEATQLRQQADEVAPGSPLWRADGSATNMERPLWRAADEAVDPIEQVLKQVATPQPSAVQAQKETVATFLDLKKALDNGLPASDDVVTELVKRLRARGYKISTLPTKRDINALESQLKKEVTALGKTTVDDAAATSAGLTPPARAAREAADLVDEADIQLSLARTPKEQQKWAGISENARKADEISKRLADETDRDIRAALEFQRRAELAEAKLAKANRQVATLQEQKAFLTQKNVDEMFRKTIPANFRELQGMGYTTDEIAEMVAPSLAKMSEFNYWVKQVYDPFLNWQKAWQITTPGFVMRNVMGGYWTNWQVGVKPESYGFWMRAEKANASGNWSKIPKHHRAVWEAVNANLPGGQVAHEIVDPTQASVARRNFGTKLGAVIDAANPTSNNTAVRWVRRFNQAAERHLRGSNMFDHLLDYPNDVDGALDRMFQAQFDYSDLSDFELAIKRVIPFYTWNKNNMVLQAQQMYQNPKTFSRMYQIKMETEAQAGPIDPIIPGYYKDELATKLPVKSGDKPVYSFQDIPSLEPFRVANRGVMDYVLNQAAVPFKLPVELQTNTQMFSGQPISKKRAKAPDSWSAIPFFMPALAAAGFAEKRNGDWTMTERDIYKAQSIVPFLGRSQRLVPSEPRYQSRLMTTLISNVLGVQVRTLTPQEIKSEQFRRKRAKQLDKYDPNEG